MRVFANVYACLQEGGRGEKSPKFRLRRMWTPPKYFWPRVCERGPISELVVVVHEGHPNLKNSQNMVIFGKFEKKFEKTMKKKIWKRKFKKRKFEEVNSKNENKKEIWKRSHIFVYT